MGGDVTHSEDAEPDLVRGGRWAPPPDTFAGQDSTQAQGRIYGKPGSPRSTDETSLLLPVLYAPTDEAAERRGALAAEIVYRRRLARLTLVSGAILAVIVVAVSLVLQAAAPNRDLTITGPANRVPAWVYAPDDGASPGSPAASPTGEASPGPTPEQPAPAYPEGGGVPGQPQPPTKSASASAPTPQPTRLRAGTSSSLRAASSSDRYVRHRNGLVFLDQITGASPAGTREQATFAVVAGLADRNCFSFRGADGRYLRHHSFRARYDADDRSDLFRRDATFCARTMGGGGGVVALESSNFRGRFLRNRDGELFLDEFRREPDFGASILFQVTTPWSK